MKIALFGGNFDPPHTAHYEIVTHLLAQGFERVWVIPCWRHPFGKSARPFWTRFHLCRQLFKHLGKQVCVSDVERRLHLSRSWTLYTVKFLKKKFPQHEFSFALGEDNYQLRHKWKGFEELESLISLIRIPRGQGSFISDYSSTQVRKAILRAEDPGASVPEPIRDQTIKDYKRS